MTKFTTNKNLKKGKKITKNKINQLKNKVTALKFGEWENCVNCFFLNKYYLQISETLREYGLSNQLMPVKINR